jgi:hypothetical protein
MMKPHDTIGALADKAQAVADGLAASVREEGRTLAGNVVETVKDTKDRAAKHLKLVR